MTCMAAEARNSTIRNSASTLASGFASSTNTRPSWAKPGEFCPSLSTHKAANNQAVCGSSTANNAIGTGAMPKTSTNPDSERICRLAGSPADARRSRTTLSTAKKPKQHHRQTISQMPAALRISGTVNAVMATRPMAITK